MPLTFRIRARSEAPPDREDPLAELLEAFAKLEPNRAIHVALEGSGAPTLQGLQTRISRRLGKKNVVYRKDPEEDGVWIWPKTPAPAGGSNAETPFSQSRNGTSGSGAAAGAGAR